MSSEENARMRLLDKIENVYHSGYGEGLNEGMALTGGKYCEEFYTSGKKKNKCKKFGIGPALPPGFKRPRVKAVRKRRKVKKSKGKKCPIRYRKANHWLECLPILRKEYPDYDLKGLAEIYQSQGKNCVFGQEPVVQMQQMQPMEMDKYVKEAERIERELKKNEQEIAEIEAEIKKLEQEQAAVGHGMTGGARKRRVGRPRKAAHKKVGRKRKVGRPRKAAHKKKVVHKRVVKHRKPGRPRKRRLQGRGGELVDNYYNYNGGELIENYHPYDGGVLVDSDFGGMYGGAKKKMKDCSSNCWINKAKKYQEKHGVSYKQALIDLSSK
jgi:hypothetical protein